MPIDNHTLDVRYQPIYDIVEGRVSGYEALVRWQLPDRGAVSPAEFIKLAEETSLIVPVGEYVLDRVLEVPNGPARRGRDAAAEHRGQLVCAAAGGAGHGEPDRRAHAACAIAGRRAEAGDHREPHAGLHAGGGR